MPFSFLRTRALGPRRLAAALLLLALFFFPLHFHFLTPTATAQVSKECGYVHANRAQLGLAQASADWTPTLQTSSLVVYEPQVLGWLSIKSQAIRAPPYLDSL